MTDREVLLTNLPDVVDIKTMLQLIKKLGGSVESIDRNRARIDSKSVNSTRAVYEIVSRMRASILVLGPLLGRFGHCEVSLPGGCKLERSR